MPETEESQSFDFGQIIQIFVRRRWLVLLTASTVTLGTIGIVQILPNRFTSEATVLVIQQQVPERYVTPTTTTDVSQALQGMTEEVLSRSRLLAIIDATGLYGKYKSRLAPEQLLDRMRKDIAIQPLESGTERRNVNSFKITFVADTGQRAQEVTARLTSLFIEENVKMREHQATVTTDFLQEHMEEVKKQLEAQEAVVRAFKMQHLGELPEQEQANSQIMASLSGQLQSTVAALGRAQEQRAYLESLLQGYQSLSGRDIDVLVGPGADIAASPAELLEKQLAQLESERNTLLSSYTPDHPDVISKDTQIAKTKALLAQAKALEAKSVPQKKGTPVVSSSRRDAAPIAQVKSQLEGNRIEIDNLTKDENRLKEKIAQYQERLNDTPVREQQLAGMMRDYELLKSNYSDLLKKQLESGLAMSLEKHQEGQQFRVVDPPSLPMLPSSPQRLKMSMGGAAGGLGLGLGLAFLLEMTQGSFYSEKRLRDRLKIPLVVGIPILLTRREARRRTWKGAVEWVAGSTVVLIMLAAEYYVYRRG